ncbi:MAG: response regulator [Hydrogenophaga sp.]
MIQSPPAGTPAAAPTFLLVDDDPLIVHALARALRPLGKVAFSTAFDDVPERVARTRPSAVLIDIDLPEITGPEIVRRIRSNPALDSVVLCLMTAHRSEAVLQEARSLPVALVLQKPIDAVALVEQMRALLHA